MVKHSTFFVKTKSSILLNDLNLSIFQNDLNLFIFHSELKLGVTRASAFPVPHHCGSLALQANIVDNIEGTLRLRSAPLRDCPLGQYAVSCSSRKTNNTNRFCVLICDKESAMSLKFYA